MKPIKQKNRDGITRVTALLEYIEQLLGVVIYIIAKTISGMVILCE